MKNITIFIAAKLIAATLVLMALTQPRPCGGVSRWNVKVATDTVSVDTTPRRITITQLAALSVPKPRRTTPRYVMERYTYRITCKVDRIIKEDDGDLHMVLIDPADSSSRMIAEVPDPECSTVRASKFAGKYAEVRAVVKSYSLTKGRLQPGIYEVTGMLFVDLPHSKPQVGVAPNNIELHPVTGFRKLDNKKHNIKR